ncbi:MAG: transcriptional repressor NrdR [Victivallales bacterium]|nr:transcriptional repressor NrdR [Victivallales bacterium]
MRCPKCSSNDDKVIETRISKEGDTIRRRRQCLQCNYRYTTYESIIPADIYVVKRDGRREDFKTDKLREGIRQACWKRNISQEQIENIVTDITNQLMLLPQSEVESQTIGELVMDALRNVDEIAYVRFASVYRRFRDADEFIDEIQKLPSKIGTQDGAPEKDKPEEGGE